MTVNPDGIKSIIDSVRDQLGRIVVFYTSTQSQCPACVAGNFIDPVTDTSFNFNCPVCKGTGWIDSVTETEVLARIHWTRDEAITASPGGKYFVGDCQLHIDPAYLSLAEDAQSESGKVLVDGHSMTITKILPAGAPTINRIRIICTNMGDRPV